MPKRKSKSRKHSTRSKPKSYMRGTYMATNHAYGFVRTKDEEVFIPASKTRDAMDGDLVEVEIFAYKAGKRKGGSGSKADVRREGSSRLAAKKAEGRVARVLERKNSEVVGRFEVAPPFGVVVPDDPRMKHDIFTKLSENPDIPNGALVKVRILEYPTRRSAATGKVVEVLSEADALSLQVERIIARYDLRTRFSEEVLEEASSQELDVESAISSGYRDIRDRYVLTIDPQDAKDFDDALSIERIHDGEYRLGVHIADVSAYVGWGGAIDLEARKRATSTYLADRVIPMLPPALSENLCSLRPDEDRLCMTCDLRIDSHANLLDADFYPAVMRSNVRLTYEQTQEMMDGDSKEDLPEKLRLLSRLAKEREAAREAKGGIDFDTEEAKVVLDDQGRPIDIRLRRRTDATKLVEEAMIFANEAVATYLYENEIPCAYRDHEPPAADALASLIPTFQEFEWYTNEMGVGIESGNPHSIQHVLDVVKGRPEEPMVTMLFLRAMMRAAYSPENLGHYGLGLSAYCHFTSPIRRYPDLIVHRFLKSALESRRERLEAGSGGVGVGFPASKGDDAQRDRESPQGIQCSMDMLSTLCKHSSEMERNAEAAAYDSQKQKMVEYMSQKVGEEFDAIISGVVSYGLYVRLGNGVEGLVPIRTLGSEYFIYDEGKNQLRGSETNVIFRLGMSVFARLTSADTALSRLDFTIV